MKYKIAMFIILLPVFATAQEKISSPAAIDRLARQVLDSAMNSTLGIDSSNDEVNMKEYNQFKNLFDSSAKLVDNFNIYYQFGRGGKAGHYRTDTTAKPFDMYAHDVALQVKSIAIDSLRISDSDIKDPGAMSYTVRRKVAVQKARQYVMGVAKDYADSVSKSRHIFFDPRGDSVLMVNNFTDILENSSTTVYRFDFTESLKVYMKYDANRNTCKITRIENAAWADKIIAVADKDNDAVLELKQEDIRNDAAGDFTANGRPDYDLDGVPDSADHCPKIYGSKDNFGCPSRYFVTSKQFDGFVGLQMNSAKINLPELNQFGYVDRNGKDAMDVMQSKKGAIRNPGQAAGIYAGVNFAYYFGRKRKNGISVGAIYSKFSASYQLTEPVVYTFKSFDGADDYRRQITINSLKEDITYNIFNFPLLYNLRWHIEGKKYKANNGKGKTIMSIKAGPSLMLFRNTSDYNAVIDFGGIYQVDPNVSGSNKITYSDFLDAASSYNVFITSQGINNQNTNPGAVNVFQQLSKSYDFASNKNYRDKKKNLTRTAFAINATFDVEKEITYKFAVKAGAHFVYAPLPEQKEKYKPIDKTTDEYNSIFNSSAKRVYSAFGITIGFVYNF
ncbi:MAG: hypothetical protein ABI760_08100 [Ferruginibacter sp.]